MAGRTRSSVTSSASSPRFSSISKADAAPGTIIDLQRLLEPLSDKDPHIRQDACASLSKSSLKHEPRVISALVQRLQDRDTYVRQGAAQALGQLARRGDEASISGLSARLSDADPNVRRVAANSLGQIAPRGPTSAVAALLGRLDDKDGGVRRAALRALEKVADKSDGKVLTALFSRTSDGEAFVRHAAVETLSRLAEEGDAEVVNRLLELLNSDRDERVRWAATEALGRLAVRGDSRVLTALLARLDDEADSVRRAAANALGHVTFAPLQELELQERQIAELEFRGAHEINSRDKTISQLEERHSMEVRRLQQRVEELEDQLRQEVSVRDRQIEEMQEQLEEQSWTCRVNEFLPHAGAVTQFLETLPAMAGPESHGKEVLAPIWALRCARKAGGAGDKDGQDKRWLLSVFELFEQLSTGSVTAEDITDARPLDVYVHQGEDGAWGLYCCSRHRLLALLMRQACARNEFFRVKCTLRPKDDQGYWSWQWSNFYDGGDGLRVQPHGGSGPRGSVNGSQTSSRMSLMAGSGFGGGGIRSSPSTPRAGGPRTASIGRSGALATGAEASEESLQPRSPRSSQQRLSAPGPMLKRVPLRAGSGAGGGAGHARNRGPSSGRLAARASSGDVGPGGLGHASESGSAEPGTPVQHAAHDAAAAAGYPGGCQPPSANAANVPTVTMSLDLDGDAVR